MHFEGQTFEFHCCLLQTSWTGLYASFCWQMLYTFGQAKSYNQISTNRQRPFTVVTTNKRFEKKCIIKYFCRKVNPLRTTRTTYEQTFERTNEHKRNYKSTKNYRSDYNTRDQKIDYDKSLEQEKHNTSNPMMSLTNYTWDVQKGRGNNGIVKKIVWNNLLPKLQHKNQD